jgi:uncharacterized protein (DUF488 family)
LEAILTIGHSNLPYGEFLGLLRDAGVTAVADVRSAPYSRQYPHFNAKALHDELRADGIIYVSLGKELGGRPKDRSFFCDGIADYERMARAPAFRHGLQRVVAGASRHRIALMCSERDPLDCHRCLLVGRALHERGLSVGHIVPDGRRKSQADIEEELLALTGRGRADFFASPVERVAAAYRARARRAAFSVSGRRSSLPIMIDAEHG